MSGGVIMVLPAGAVIVPVAAVAAGARAAALLAVRAAQAGTEAAGRALEQCADTMELEADSQDDLEMCTRRWEVAAGAVARTNQDRRLLAARAERVGVRAALPQPLELTGHTLEDARVLVTRAQEALDTARTMIERAEAVQEQQTLLAELPVGVDAAPTAADLLARHQEVLAERRRNRSTNPRSTPTEIDGSLVRAEIEKILTRLDDDATEADREKVLLVADRAARKKDAGTTRTYLDALARTVDKEVNPRAARRRDAAGLLDALEHPVVADMINDFEQPLPPWLDSIERLRAVVSGDADLSDKDRHRAQTALVWAHHELDRRRLLDAVAEAFTGLGYSVTTGVQIHHAATLSVTRHAWHDKHAAAVWIDDAGQVRSRLVQLSPKAGGEATRCADLNDSMRSVGAELTRRGLDAHVHIPAKPVQALVSPSASADQATSLAIEESRKVRTIDPER